MPSTSPEELVKNVLTVESNMLGPLSVSARQVYTFERGIYGFPSATRFALLPTDRDGFFWLQSLDLPPLTFLLVDPFRFVDDYSVDLEPEVLSGFLPEEESEVMVLTTLTPGDDSGGTTTNLQAPIALNLTDRRGKQIVIDGPFAIRHPIEVPKRSGPRSDLLRP